MEITQPIQLQGRLRFITSGYVIFVLCWLLTAALYLPTAKAGWVIDAAGWLHSVRNEDFLSYINRTHSNVESLYQFTQLITWVFYKMWGDNLWCWSVLYITLHAANASMLYSISNRLFLNSGTQNGFWVAISATLLFTCCPHVSEVVVWKACYHYLQGFLFILLQLYWAQKYQSKQRKIYPWLGALLFLISIFTLEIFYLTPIMVACLAIYYRYALGYSKANFKKTILSFLLPQFLILGLYFILFFITYNSFRPHVSNVYSQHITDYLSKPLKYFFHIVLLGRYTTPAFKEQVYAICETKPMLWGAYSLFTLANTYLFVKSVKTKKLNNPAWLLLAFTTVTLALLMPLPFPPSAQLVFYDRYCYFACGFIFLLLLVLLFRYVRLWLALTVVSIVVCINVYFTIHLNTCWKQSAYVTNRLLNSFDAITTQLGNTTTKTTILLNVPENMQGAPMIGSDPDGAFQGLYALNHTQKPSTHIYEALSYNMNTQSDGAHVTVLNDSVIRVTLNQWGTWWWYGGHGGISYTNKDYKINLIDAGNIYEITLLQPSDQYLLLYEVAANWKKVNMQLKNTDQY